MGSYNIAKNLNNYEMTRFELLCHKNGVSVEKGITLLIRKACQNLTDFPLEFDYEDINHLHKEKVLECAEIFKMADFIRYVKNGFFNDYDGEGFISDGEYEYYPIFCNVAWLEAQPDTFKYVAWYNK